MYARIGREEGQQIILVSLMLPVLLVFVGLVIDVGNLYFHRRTAQNAADAAAVAGSVELSNWDNARTTALAYARDNGYNNSTGNTVTVTPKDTDGNKCIEVQINEDVRPLLVSLVWNGAFDVGAYARACKMTVALEARVLLLKEDGRSLYLNGNSQLTVKQGNIHINSDSEDAVEIKGNPQVHNEPRIQTGTATTSVHELDDDVKEAFSPEPTVEAYKSDPLEGLSPPDRKSCKKLDDIKKDTTLPPGCYTGGINVKKGTLTLDPGHYWIEDGIELSGNATIIGRGVMLYIADSDDVDLSGCERCSFTPPSTGVYAGITFFGARSDEQDHHHHHDGDGPTFTFYGDNSVTTLEGIVYNPNGAVELSGKATFKVNLYVNSLSLQGNDHITIEGYEGAGWGTTEYRMTQ